MLIQNITQWLAIMTSANHTPESVDDLPLGMMAVSDARLLGSERPKLFPTFRLIYLTTWSRHVKWLAYDHHLYACLLLM